MPYLVTMARAVLVARCRSLDAPVEMSPSTSSSAARPPRQAAMLSFSSVRER